MIGRRRDECPTLELEAGDYAVQQDGSVFFRDPTGMIGHVEKPLWSITINDDRTVTVSPSIWNNKPAGWHGFLERGVWRAAT